MSPRATPKQIVVLVLVTVLIIAAGTALLLYFNGGDESRSLGGPNPATCEDIINGEHSQWTAAHRDVDKEFRADIQAGKEPSWILGNRFESSLTSFVAHQRKMLWLEHGLDSLGNEAMSPGESPAHCTYRWWRWDWDNTLRPEENGRRGYIADSLGVTWRDFGDGKVTDTLCRMADFDTQELIGAGLAFMMMGQCS